MNTLEYTLKDSLVGAYVEGKPFLDWVDETPRSNGYNSGDLINRPPYIIEDIIRYWLLCEKDLTKSNFDLVNYYIEFNGPTNYLLSSEDDYYNGAYLVSLNRGWVKKVIDYDGTNKRLYFDVLYSSEMTLTNNFLLFNINANIDTSSFDAVGNTTDGLRKDWKFNKSINKEYRSEDLLNSALYESHSVLFTTYENYRIRALDSAYSSSGTLSQPLKVGGTPQVFVDFTPLEELYTEFTLNYAYDEQSQNYKFSHFVRKDGSSDATNLGSTYQTYCGDAESNYRINKKFTYDSEWIQDSTTAYLLLQKLCRWYTKQKMIVTWLGNIETHLKYEEGDLVLINYPRMMPTSKNNSQKFMVIERTIIPDKFDPQVRLKLLEIPT